MSEILKNPIKPRKKTHEGKYPFEFKAPSYDNRTSCSMGAGDDYGTGFKNPIGKESVSGSFAVPQKSHAFSAKEIFQHEDVAG